MTAPGTLELVGQELALVFQPLEDAFAADGAEGLLTALGLRPPPDLAAAPALVDALGRATAAAVGLPAVIAQLVAAFDAGDAGAITSAGLALIDKIKDAIQGIAGVAGALDALATSFAGLTSAQRDELRAFAQAFAERVMGHLLFDYVERRFRPVFVMLFAAGAIELVDVAGGPAGSLAAAHQRKVVHFDRILRLVTDPLGLLRDVYRWGAADFDGLALFRMLKSLLDSTLEISADSHASEPTSGFENHSTNASPRWSTKRGSRWNCLRTPTPAMFQPGCAWQPPRWSWSRSSRSSPPRSAAVPPVSKSPFHPPSCRHFNRSNLCGGEY